MFICPLGMKQKTRQKQNMASTINSTVGRPSSGTTPVRDGSPYGSAIVDYRSGAFGNGTVASSPIVKMIKESSLYRNAYDVLSADTKYGEPFLFELTAIPESISMRSENFWDKFVDTFGGTSGYDQQIVDLFGNAMDEIRLLMQRYNNFIANLPVNQSEQLRDAGVNASITGEGLTPSSPESVSPIEHTPTSEYSRQNSESISAGISNFLSFVDSFSSVASLAIDLEYLDIDRGKLKVSEDQLQLERDKINLLKNQDYRDQENHDLNLIKQGVSPTSPNSVLGSSDQSVLKDYSADAIYKQRLQTVASKSDVNALYNRTYAIPGNPRASGLDVFNRISQYKLSTMFGRITENAITQGINTSYAQILGTLDREYLMSAYSAGARENEFNQSAFQFRSPSVEGRSYSTLQSQMVDLYRNELALQEHQIFMNSLKELHILDWQDDIENDPSVLPFYYKAALDFDMEGTFHHQDSLHQNVHYGLNTANQAVGLIESISRSFNNFKNDPAEIERIRDERFKKRTALMARMAAARMAMQFLL